MARRIEPIEDTEVVLREFTCRRGDVDLGRAHPERRQGAALCQSRRWTSPGPDSSPESQPVFMWHLAVRRSGAGPLDHRPLPCEPRMKNQAQLIAYVDRLPGGTFRDLQQLLDGPLAGCVRRRARAAVLPSDRWRRRRLRSDRSHAGRSPPGRVGRRRGARGAAPR